MIFWEDYFFKTNGEMGEKIAIKSHQLYDHSKKGGKISKENFWILKTETKIITILKIKN